MASSRSSKKLTQPTPRPSARAASQRFCTAHAVEYDATCGWACRPSTWRPPRVGSQVTTTLSGVSRIASTFRSLKARARAPGSPAANTSCWWRARACARSRTVPVAEHDEVPRLAQPHAGRLMRGGQHPGQHVVGDRVGEEAVADVAAPGDHLVQRIDIGPGHRVGRRPPRGDRGAGRRGAGCRDAGSQGAGRRDAGPLAAGPRLAAPRVLRRAEHVLVFGHVFLLPDAPCAPCAMAAAP